MDQLVIKLAEEFTNYLGARHRTDGPFSAQQFYEEILKSKLTEIWDDPEKTILIDFDGTMGPASSFVSEILKRAVEDFTDKEKILQKINYKSDEDPLLLEFIEKAAKKLRL